MKKLSLALILAIPSISSIAATPTQQALETVNQKCSFQLNSNKTYFGCPMVTVEFPFQKDATFKKKFFDVLKKSGFTYTGDPIGSFDPEISPQRVFSSSVITPLSKYEVKYSLVDKNRVEYGMIIYYAPKTNKMVIMPYGKEGDVTHKWLGDVKDSNLKNAIIQRELNEYRLWEYEPSHKESVNQTLREIKVNLGVDAKFDNFPDFDPTYRLSYERK